MVTSTYRVVMIEKTSKRSENIRHNSICTGTESTQDTLTSTLTLTKKREAMCCRDVNTESTTTHCDKRPHEALIRQRILGKMWFQNRLDCVPYRFQFQFCFSNFLQNRTMCIRGTLKFLQFGFRKVSDRNLYMCVLKGGGTKEREMMMMTYSRDVSRSEGA